MSDERESGAISKHQQPAPESCGFHVTITEDLVLQITLRSSFDSENKGRPWAGDIINAYNMPLLRIEVDFSHSKIVSSTVFAGLVQLYQGFQGKTTEGVHLLNVGTQVMRSLNMLKLDKIFTVKLRGQN